MKILWLINIVLPEVSLLLNEKTSPFGGWLVNTSQDLSKRTDIELSIAFPKKTILSYKKIKGNKITYYAFKPLKEKNIKLIECNSNIKHIIDEVQPDIVHIYGTEMAHTLAMVNVCKKQNIKTIITIQGLVSIIAKHIYANLPLKAIYGFTLRNIIRKDNVIGLKRLYIRRGKNEIEAIKNVNYLIGRTNWDKACTFQINPNAQYYFCNETLREEFYHLKWDINQCEKHSIFLSKAQYPIKGLHYVLEAMPIILKRFPDTKLFICGRNIIKSDTISDKLLMTYYGKYIMKLILKYKLENNIEFLGTLDVNEICQRYLKSNVFVCPSTIENSSNSLGEAMLLGVPCVASYVGGIADLLKNREEGFVYQTDAPYMLAHYVCELFDKEELAHDFSEKAREHALKTHDRDINTKRLVEIYNKVV